MAKVDTEALGTDNREKKHGTRKEIASGGLIVSETIDCYGNCPEYKTIVTGFGGRIVGKFDDRISVSDARMIANAPNMVEMLMKMESAISSMIYNDALPCTSYLFNLIHEVRCVIDNANGRK